MQSDEQDEDAADKHHPLPVPVEKVADERHGEQSDRRIEQVGDRRPEADGEARPASVIEGTLDADDAQRPERNRSRKADQDRLQEIDDHSFQNEAKV